VVKKQDDDEEEESGNPGHLIETNQMKFDETEEKRGMR
jgi:hypothetical protein